MPWVRLAALAELEVGQPLRVELDVEDAVCLVRTDDGVHALVDNCSHEDYPLSEGWVEEGTIECALHGSQFDLASGKPLSPPAVAAVRTYPTRVGGDQVEVDLPDHLAELADQILSR
jgi:3-phenylpropionate/trans-cinnamate dioxygenase ferredoxin component